MTAGAHGAAFLPSSPLFLRSAAVVAGAMASPRTRLERPAVGAAAPRAAPYQGVVPIATAAASAANGAAATDGTAAAGATAPSPPRILSGLAELFPPPPARRRYDALLLDQFGVLHDGTSAYPLAPAAVAAAAAAGVHLLILSNTSRRAAEALAKLPTLGFPASTPWAGAVTSGELAHAELVGHPSDYAGVAVLHTNWVGRGGVPLPETGLVPVGADAAAAELLLTHGTEGVTAAGGDGSVVEALPYDDLVALVTSVARRGDGDGGSDGGSDCGSDGGGGSNGGSGWGAGSCQRRPPRAGLGVDPSAPPVLLCANPDIVTVDGAALRPMPGALAAAYEAAGGPVVRLGKPAPPPYAAALAVLADRGVTDARRVLAVGDSVGHDVRGAADAGIDSLWVGGGIHAERVGLCHADAGDNGLGREGRDQAGGKRWVLDPAALADVCAEEGMGDRRPTYAIPFFRW